MTGRPEERFEAFGQVQVRALQCAGRPLQRPGSPGVEILLDVEARDRLRDVRVDAVALPMDWDAKIRHVLPSSAKTGHNAAMTEVTALLQLLRAHGTDTATVEAKASGRALPRSVRETLSSFSNDHGGTVLLGVAEEQGFTATGVADPIAVRDALADLCSQGMDPQVRADIDIVEVEGVSLVVAQVSELPPQQKPCFVKAQGLYLGSYTRTGDGNRKLTQYEVGLLLAGRGQPRDDIAPVVDATIEDLNAEAVNTLLAGVRRRQPSAFEVDDSTALQRLRVLVQHDGRLVPSLAGLLTLGNYPQQFFPQVNVTFVSIPGTSMGDVPVDGPRFLDNQSIDGPLPLMVADALRVLARNMAMSSTITGAGREDRYEYPLGAMREAIVNALMHRDYSVGALGAQVQIEMYRDRLVIRSPGGLFGAVTEDELGGEGISTTRNAHLATLLADVLLPGTGGPVAENRGSGIPTMLAILRRAGLTLPVFTSRIASFNVSFPRHSLLEPATLEWLATLGPLSDEQRMALALMHEGRVVTNGILRQLGVDSRLATGALTGLVALGHARTWGGRRYAQYALAPRDGPRLGETDGEASLSEASRPASEWEQRLARTLALFGPSVTLSAAEVTGRLGVPRRTALGYVNALIERGELMPTAPAKSPLRRYRHPT